MGNIVKTRHMGYIVKTTHII